MHLAGLLPLPPSTWQGAHQRRVRCCGVRVSVGCTNHYKFAAISTAARLRQVQCTHSCTSTVTTQRECSLSNLWNAVQVLYRAVPQAPGRQMQAADDSEAPASGGLHERMHRPGAHVLHCQSQSVTIRPMRTKSGTISSFNVQCYVNCLMVQCRMSIGQEKSAPWG